MCCILTSDPAKKKCTCVNNRCIRSKISGDQGMALTVVRLNWVDVKQWYNPGDRKFRSVGVQSLKSEFQFELWEPALSRELGPQAPGWAAQENGERKAMIVRRVGGGSICSVSNSLCVCMVVTIQQMDMAIRVQILDKADCISHHTNTLGKGMNPIILPPAMGK